MAWYAVDLDGSECRYEYKPVRATDMWMHDGGGRIDELPKGTIGKLAGRRLKWEDEPIEVI
jgi:hypothetical protein